MAETAKTKRYDKILEIIEDRLIPDESAKKARGEVFTPLNLVRQMLYGTKKNDIKKIWGMDNDGNFIEEEESNRIGGIPLTIFRNEDSTFLDPANGIGNFSIVAFQILDYELGKHNQKFSGEKNKEKRRKYIIENMLYMIEINKGNINTSKKILNEISKDATPNILCTDTLALDETKINKYFNKDKFTVIMGNPPFQIGGTHQSGTQIWNFFVIGDTRKAKKHSFPGALSLLEDNGCLLFVIPQGWRSPSNNDILLEMKKGNLHFVNILEMKSQDRFPNINYPLDYFIYINNKKNSKTTIVNENYNIKSTIVIDKLDIIPNYAWKIFEKWSEENLERLTFIRDHSTPSGKLLAKGEFPIISNINEKGVKIKYSKIPNKYQNIMKVLVAFGAYLYPTVDDKKQYGVSENVFIIECDTKEDAEKIKNYLENPSVKCLIEALKISSYAVSNSLLSYIPSPLKFKKGIEEELFIDEEQEIIDKCKTILAAKQTRKVTKKKGGGRFNKTRKVKK